MLVAGADLAHWTAAEVPGDRALFTGAYVPGDPSTMLIGSIGDGVFRVAGGEWTPSSTGLLGAGCESIAVSPEDPDTLFVGCGNAAFFFQLLRIVGLDRAFVRNEAMLQADDKDCGKLKTFGGVQRH